jgi:H+/Cl- antiporter ClcA
LLTPALATGAALGVFTGRLWSLLWPGAPLTQYALVGAAALLAVTQRAPVTAVLLTLEFVGTAQALLPSTLVGVALATGTAAVLRRHRPSDAGPDGGDRAPASGRRRR